MLKLRSLLAEGKRPASETFNIMHPVSHATCISHVSVLWKTLDSCVELCQGQPGSPVLRLPIHDTILAQHDPETSALCHGRSVDPAPASSRLQYFFTWKGQQIHKRGARQLMWNQTNGLAQCACAQSLLRSQNLQWKKSVMASFLRSNVWSNVIRPSPCTGHCIGNAYSA